MLATPGEVKRVLSTIADFYDPVTGSLILLPEMKGKDQYRQEPFKHGFLDSIDERHELVRRVNALGDRERRLLIMWHVQTLPKTQIAHKLGISRVHCYRVHKQALDAIVQMGEEAAGSGQRGAPEICDG